ncbi:MAG: hypothetical protein JST65_03065 [Acidobacteria bacterium]|nr:hypothetical protein [Acidobacteriota bacterium]
MQGYWIKFTDGTAGYCQGQGTYDAVRIAEKLTGKKVVVEGDDKYHPKLDTLPYPATPIIWQFDHPVSGKCPAFCLHPEQCKGMLSCPRKRACDD